MCCKLCDQKIAGTTNPKQAIAGYGVFIEQSEIRRAPAYGLKDAQQPPNENQMLILGSHAREQTGQQSLQSLQSHSLKSTDLAAVAKIDQ